MSTTFEAVSDFRISNFDSSIIFTPKNETRITQIGLEADCCSLPVSNYFYSSTFDLKSCLQRKKKKYCYITASKMTTPLSPLLMQNPSVTSSLVLLFLETFLTS